MPAKRICFVIAFCACAAFGQSVSQTIVFSHVDTPQALQEFVNTIRTIGDIKNTTSNWTDKSITVNGTEEQISLAAWLAKELNDAPSSRQAMVEHDYPGTAGSNDEVRVYFLANTHTPQELQEVV